MVMKDFLRQVLTLHPRLVWKSLQSLGWPQTLKKFYLSFLCPRIKDKFHTAFQSFLIDQQVKADSYS